LKTQAKPQGFKYRLGFAESPPERPEFEFVF
jgi:hypothetical protein